MARINNDPVFLGPGLSFKNAFILTSARAPRFMSPITGKSEYQKFPIEILTYFLFLDLLFKTSVDPSSSKLIFPSTLLQNIFIIFFVAVGGYPYDMDPYANEG